MAEARRPRGLIDTSVVVALEHIDPEDLPIELAVSAVTMAELAAGPHVTQDTAERARRQDRLQRAEASFTALPVDADVARAYGRVYAQAAESGRKARGRRPFDLLIAATALAGELPLYTGNPRDFSDLGGVVEVVPVEMVSEQPRGERPRSAQQAHHRRRSDRQSRP
ncbi:MAG: type II toxin-antitoxin system VapC family toxin [Candidatus Dormibacteria bacterium]